jgi:hypothetical protein
LMQMKVFHSFFFFFHFLGVKNVLKLSQNIKNLVEFTFETKKKFKNSKPFFTKKNIEKCIFNQSWLLCSDQIISIVGKLW